MSDQNRRSILSSEHVQRGIDCFGERRQVILHGGYVESRSL